MKLVYTLILLLCGAAAAQDRNDWQALSQLKTGDRVRLSLTTQGPVTGGFRSWTPELLTVGSVSARRAEVVRVERYRQGGWSRGKTAAAGALIGFGGGFAIGAAAGGCHPGAILCFSRGTLGGAFGGAGAVIGAAVGALLPHRHKELIYAIR